MSLLKYVAIGAAVAYGVNLLVKKSSESGKSVVDELSDQAPQWLEHLKKYGREALDEITNRAQQAKESI